MGGDSSVGARKLQRMGGMGGDSSWQSKAPGSTPCIWHRYPAPRVAGEGGAEGDRGVSFKEHTDGAWLTLVPCSTTPGLEVCSELFLGADRCTSTDVQSAALAREMPCGRKVLEPPIPAVGVQVKTANGWVCPELHAPPGSVAVMVGDGLQFLSRNQARPPAVATLRANPRHCCLIDSD